ncbi:MAG: carotenoid oxygenase family protein [Novosphingobium sp.]|nr:carotenoid oxygenase family protein [Novosphingobium sp.]
MATSVKEAIVGTVGKGIGLVADFNRGRMKAELDHPFLSGIHRPMEEELTLTELDVEGQIPAALDGSYMRTGPNPFAPDPAGYHWFTGDGMVHAIRLQGGKALAYRNRWVRSRSVAALGGPEAAPGPRRGQGDNVNTNVAAVAGRPLVMVEAGSYPVRLDHELGAQEYTNFDGSLDGAFSAHPHLDPATGENHAIVYDASNPNELRHVVVDAAGKVRRELAIPVINGPSVHDCALTARYVLVFDLPVTFSMKALLGGFRFPYRWNREHCARVGLLPREGSADDIVWCDVDPCYVFHVSNAFDREDGAVVVDVCAYETMFDGGMKGPNGKNLGLERWTIDPAAGTVERRTIDATPQEFPRPDERLFGLPYRHAWSVALPESEVAGFMGASCLIAHDLVAGTRTVRDFGKGRLPGEFVFVPRAEDAPESEGWLMGLVIDGTTETTELVILDAQDFSGPAVATVHLPHRIPPGFHGNWIPA